MKLETLFLAVKADNIQVQGVVQEKGNRQQWLWYSSQYTGQSSLSAGEGGGARQGPEGLCLCGARGDKTLSVCLSSVLLCKASIITIILLFICLFARSKLAFPIY